MAIKTEPKALQLRHPELEDSPSVMAEIRQYWRDHQSRVIGLVLRFRGESQERCLTYSEIAALQSSED